MASWLWVVFFGGFAAAVAAPPLARVAPRWAGGLLAMVPAGVAVYVGLAMTAVGAGDELRVAWRWIAALDVTLSLRLDGLSGLFALLVSGVGALVFVYAGGYMREHEHVGRFLGLLMLFFAGMLGLVLADNLLLIYVCWELTTISSWLLIGFEHRQAEARQAAWQALVVTAAGGLSLLVGLVLIGQTVGTYELDAVLARGEALRQSALYLPALALVLAGAATKSALVPLHFWLPNAMAAPTPVSAYLHSAAMVKAGIYLLARLSPVLAETPAWRVGVTGVGAVTAVVAAWLALMQSDLKRLLAYTTISALGMMTLALGVGGATGARAALVLLLAHGLYKGALFMMAGAFDHGAGTRDLRELGGLWRVMPFTAIAGGLSMMSMVGLPPTLGFIAEDRLVELGLHASGARASGASGAWGVALLVAVLLAGTLYTAAGFVAVVRPLVGARREGAGGHGGKHGHDHEPHEVSVSLWAPPAVLGVAGIALACVPGAVDRALIGPAVEAVAGTAPESHLALWHGITRALLLGVGMLLVGGVIAWAWPTVRTFGERLAQLPRAIRLPPLGQFGPDRAYHQLDAGLNATAHGLVRVLQHGYLPAYLLLVLVALLVLATPPLLWAGVHLPEREAPVGLADAALIIAILGAALGAIACRGRIAVVACTSMVGYTVAIFFALFGGADLALTQVLVETLLAVMIIILLPALPRFEPMASRGALVRDGVICLAVGGLVAALLLASGAVGGAAEPRPISAAYLAHARGDAPGGGNLVSAILVNFRAVDTLGEVSVLAAAAIGIATLLDGHRARAAPAAPAIGRDESQVLAVATGVLMPLLVLFAAFLLVTGHHAPGGGFAAALVLAAAMALQLFGRAGSPQRAPLPLGATALLTLGLLIMVGSGLPGLLDGAPYLTARWPAQRFTILGDLRLGTPVIFDLGIGLAAAGALTLILRTPEAHSPWRL